MYQRILVAVDGSAAAQHALDESMALAKRLHACLLILTVVDATPPLGSASLRDVWEQDALPIIIDASRSMLERANARAFDADVRMQTVVSVMPARSLAGRILEHASGWQADLLILGSHGRRGLERLRLGSVAEDVARRAAMPVLIVHEAIG